MASLKDQAERFKKFLRLRGIEEVPVGFLHDRYRRIELVDEEPTLSTDDNVEILSIFDHSTSVFNSFCDNEVNNSCDDNMDTDSETERDVSQAFEDNMFCGYKISEGVATTENDSIQESSTDNVSTEESFNKWEFNVKTTNFDSSNVPAISSQENNFASIDSNSKSKTFEDGISLSFVDKTKLLYLKNVYRFKNNITTIISSDSNSYLVAADNSDLAFYEFDDLCELPKKQPALKISTHPTFTTDNDRLIATRPRYPHSINFLRVFNNFCGKQVIVACTDDGSILIWFSDEIINHIIERQKNYVDSNLTNTSRCVPDFRIKMVSSCWCVDIGQAFDEYGHEHYIILASDNSQKVTCIFYHEADNQFYDTESQPALHNIPEVSIISYHIDGEFHRVKVSCASVSEELIVFRFKFAVALGPLTQHQLSLLTPCHYINCHFHISEPGDFPTHDRMERVIFQPSVVRARNKIGESCWTTKPVSSKHFKSVSCLAELFGNPDVDEVKEMSRISLESEVLTRPMHGSSGWNRDLGGYVKDGTLSGCASKFQFYKCPTTLLTSDMIKNTYDKNDDDEIRRVKKDYFRTALKADLGGRSNLQKHSTHLKKGTHPKSENSLLVVSSEKRVFLFQTGSLICNSGTDNVFDMKIPCNSETEHCDRISISEFIPELQCLIAVSQQGLLSVFRLCEYKGIYGMRQEHVFPNATKIAFSDKEFRSIAGIAIKDKSLSQFSRFLLYIIYNDGLVLLYRLLISEDGFLIVDDIDL